MRNAIMTIFGALLLAQPAWAEIGRIKHSAGTGAVGRGKARLPLTPGLQLEPGDVMVTGKDGEIGATFIDDTRFAVGPGSRVLVSDFAFDRATQVGRFMAHVMRGSLAVVPGQIARSARDAMKICTPTSLLGVRGRRFIVEVR